MSLELGLADAVLAHDIFAQLGQVAELPLAGGVVHQADDADPVLGPNLSSSSTRVSEQTSARRCRYVADLQRPFRAEAQDFVGQDARIFAVVCLAFDTTEPTRSASKTVVMPTLASSASCAMIAAAWGQSTLGRGSMWRFKVVGVQLDQARA